MNTLTNYTRYCGKTYIEIIEETKLSSATISRVSRAVTHGSGGYKTFVGDGNEL